MIPQRVSDKNNLKIVAIFFIGLTIFIGISFLFKLITIILKSKFDGLHTFNLLTYTKDLSEKKATLFSLSPDKGTITIMHISGKLDPKKLGYYIKAPIDGYVVPTSLAIFKNSFGKNRDEVIREIKNLLFNRRETNVTFVDLIRLCFYASGISSHSIITREIVLPLDDLSLDRITSFLFTDREIVREKISIAIVNGTGVAGLGNRIARLITNIGGNVVSVSTSDNLISDSEILYSKENNYTARRIAQILSFKINNKDNMDISDVTIFIGKNNLSNLLF